MAYVTGKPWTLVASRVWNNIFPVATSSTNT
jgi:hypothetical protein